MTPQEKARAFREEVLEKISKTVQEFADGKLSSEQFQAIYARYTEQLSFANMAMMGAEDASFDLIKGDGMQTIAMRSQLQGKAVGMMIYHNQSGMIVEILGNPDLPLEELSPLFNDFSEKMLLGESEEPLVKKIADKQWLVMAGGRYTTIATQFRHEPALRQIEELERLHADFEKANHGSLAKTFLMGGDLAFPFITLVERRMSK